MIQSLLVVLQCGEGSAEPLPNTAIFLVTVSHRQPAEHVTRMFFHKAIVRKI